MNDFKNKINTVNELWDDLQNDLTKFTEKKNQAASVRVRNNALKISEIMKEIRKEVLDLRPKK
ncbi:MAG: histone H1 [Spirochaetes bacterium]|nr:MAG: histone H1 [Spirochaetota bacterium]